MHQATWTPDCRLVPLILPLDVRWCASLLGASSAAAAARDHINDDECHRAGSIIIEQFYCCGEECEHESAAAGGSQACGPRRRCRFNRRRRRGRAAHRAARPHCRRAAQPRQHQHIRCDSCRRRLLSVSTSRISSARADSASASERSLLHHHSGCVPVNERREITRANMQAAGTNMH
jgi:hypothetical protein